ncbi:MAG: biotin-dependent carboxyltransferase [Candidatus Rokubacteria bacterium]|nr:biotin-dependent carboxyltransferase [Candidatus Rokubacteria bacterium]
MNVLEVLAGGVSSTVQDVGRPGYLATGMPASGPADRFALGIANLLVGNDPGERYLVGRRPGDAGIEVLLSGLRVRVLADTVIAITGADLAPTVDDRPLPVWRAIAVSAGAVLVFHQARAGARAYLAVAGGIDVPTFAGSRATNVRAFVGGVDGRALKAGDVLRAFPPKRGLAELGGRRLRRALVPVYGDRWTVRVVLGPQDDLFLPESVQTFLAYDWRLSPTSDRMGCRYVGPTLEFKPRPAYLVEQAGSDPSNIVDDTIPVGGIQVPGGVEPIVLHVDGPSLGGYAKIATVISADLGKVGQTRPGHVTRFQAVSTGEAVDALRELEDSISEANLEKA